MLFSVVIPTYNRAHLIADTIKSVLNQTYQNFEVIVVDDGSSDNTEEVVKSIISDKLFYYKKENCERGASRNYGLKVSKGDYINYFDSDDFMMPNHLQVAYDTILKCKYEAFHLGYNIVDDKGNLLKEFRYTSEVNDKLIAGNLLSINPMFLKRDIALENMFSENREISGLEDWELWLRIALNYSIKTVEIVTSSIINHEYRSVLQTEKDKLIARVLTFKNLVLNNKAVVNYYKGKMHLFEESCLTYISLHLALTKKHRLPALNYMFKGILKNPLFIFKRRFLAIIKHCII
jgi:glycosyltransferase involved in cell wall biosynthesis